MNSPIVLARDREGVLAEARIDGLYVFQREKFESPRALQAALQLPDLLSSGLAHAESGGVVVPFECFSKVLQEGFTLPFLWSRWSPFFCAINTRGSLARGSLRYFVTFRHGETEAEIHRTGRYICRTGHAEAWLLDDITFALLTRIETARAGLAAWIDYAFIKACAHELGLELEGAFRSTDVIFPAVIRSMAAPGGIQSVAGPVIDEAPAVQFQRALRAGSSGSQRMGPLLIDRTRSWLILDDDQLEGISEPGLRSRPEVPAVSEWVGRVGTRFARFGASRERVPVRGLSPAGFLDSEPSGGGRRIYDREILGAPLSRLQALVACVYQARGFKTILLPQAGNAGTAVIAAAEEGIWLVAVDTEAAGLESLAALAAMRRFWERLVDHPYRLALFVRNDCSRELRARADILPIELRDREGFIDEVESLSISSEDVKAAELCRCPSVRAAADLISKSRPPVRNRRDFSGDQNGEVGLARSHKYYL